MSETNPEQTGVEIHPENTYQESEDFVPDATMVTGTLDTSGTAGSHDQRVEDVTPVFDAAKAQDLQYAAKAVDPEDKSVQDTHAVVLPEGDRTNDEAKQAVAEQAESFREDPVEVKDPTVKAQEKNAEQVEGESRVDTASRVQSQQQQAAPTGQVSVDQTDNSGVDVAQKSAAKEEGGETKRGSGSKGKGK